MDRNRLLLAFVLMMMVAIAPSIIWPPKKPADRRIAGSADSSAVRDSARQAEPPEPPTAQPSDNPSIRPSADTGRIVRVTSPLYRLGFSTRGGAVLLIDLSSGLRSVEKDSLDDYRHYSVVTKASKTERTDFSSIRPNQRALLNGPFEWVGVKSKYFLTAALALEEGQPTFGGAIAVGGPRSGKAASRATVLITMPVQPAGTFRYSVYTGPLDYRQLGRMGHGLDDANPYGGIFRPIIRLVSLFVTSILLWMHERLHLAYGWALIIFGIVVRLAL